MILPNARKNRSFTLPGNFNLIFFKIIKPILIFFIKNLVTKNSFKFSTVYLLKMIFFFEKQGPVGFKGYPGIPGNFKSVLSQLCTAVH